jgi:hypothetical protein
MVLVIMISREERFSRVPIVGDAKPVTMVDEAVIDRVYRKSFWVGDNGAEEWVVFVGVPSHIVYGVVDRNDGGEVRYIEFGHVLHGVVSR